MRTHHRFTCCSLLLSMLLAMGCGQPNQKLPPQLKYVRIGRSEDVLPPVFGIEIQNTGETPATVEGCSVKVLSTHLFSVRKGSSPWPEKFEHYVQRYDTPQGNDIAPGQTGVVPVSLIWDLPETVSGIVAVCKVEFSIQYDGDADVETEPFMFLIPSDPDALEAIKDKQPNSVVAVPGTIEEFNSFQGKKSPEVEQLIKLLREVPEE